MEVHLFIAPVLCVLKIVKRLLVGICVRDNCNAHRPDICSFANNVLTGPTRRIKRVRILVTCGAAFKTLPAKGLERPLPKHFGWLMNRPLQAKHSV